MQVMTVVQSIAANSTSLNLLAGQVNEFLAGPSAVNVYARAAVVGANLVYQVGNEVFVQNQELPAQAGFPTRNENFFVQGVGGKGERIVATIQNTTGAAIIVQLLFEIVRVR